MPESQIPLHADLTTSSAVESSSAAAQQACPVARRIVVRELGRQAYQPVWEAMKAFTDQRNEQTPDEIWLLEHDPVFTQGQAGKSEHVLAPGDIPVVPVDRGGQVTYHGPGQLVAYLMLDIARQGIGARELVTRIETCLVQLLAEFGVTAYPREDAPGVYVDGAKIASLGLRIRKGRSFHGLALNLDMDLEPFSRINPCGYQGLAMTQLKALTDASREALKVAAIGQRLSRHLIAAMGYQQVSLQRGLPQDE